MYVKHMLDGRSRNGEGEDSEKKSQARHMGTESTPRGGTSTSTPTDNRPPCFEVEKHGETWVEVELVWLLL
jgi:hypothetical protein